MADPGFPVGGGGGADLRHVHFLAKTYAKMKEMDPVGGRVPEAPPGSANACISVTHVSKVPVIYLQNRKNKKVIYRNLKSVVLWFDIFKIYYKRIIQHRGHCSCVINARRAKRDCVNCATIAAIFEVHESSRKNNAKFISSLKCLHISLLQGKLSDKTINHTA